MSEFINTADVIGEDALVDSIIDRSITEYKDNRVQNVRGYAFHSCTALAEVDLPNCKTVNHNSFGGCTSLTTMVLCRTTICSLKTVDGLQNTPIASGTGYIYVPRALVEDYKTATNWSAYAAQFRALEDYTVDGTVTGALDESKI